MPERPNSQPSNKFVGVVPLVTATAATVNIATDTTDANYTNEADGSESANQSTN